MDVEEKNIPDICTNVSCYNYGCDYCRKCSHAHYRGSAWIGGRFWTWIFCPRTGPKFNFDLEGNHPGWDIFDKWIEENFN